MNDGTKCPCCGQIVVGSDDIQTKLKVMLGSKWAPKQQMILGALAYRFNQVITTNRMTEVIWGDDIDGGPDDPNSVIRAHVCKLRPKLKPFGFVIDTHWGIGYKMRATDVS